jgi:hypothetical protein
MKKTARALKPRGYLAAFHFHLLPSPTPCPLLPSLLLSAFRIFTNEKFRSWKRKR